MAVTKRAIVLYHRLTAAVRPNELRLLTVQIGDVLYRINVFCEQTPSFRRRELWFLSGSSALGVVDGLIDRRSNHSVFSRLLLILEEERLLIPLLAGQNLMVAEECADHIEKAAVAHRLLEARNDYRLLHRTFGEPRYERVAHRFETCLYALRHSSSS